MLLSIYILLVNLLFATGLESCFSNRTAPQWYDKAKIGIKLTWGLFCVPSFRTENFWKEWQGPSKNKEIVQFMHDNYRRDFQYADFAPEFRAELLNLSDWVRIIGNSGAKYAIITAKHSDGYAMWPSSVAWNWNSMFSGPKKDIVGEFKAALSALTNFKFGIDYALEEWFNSLFLQDKASEFTSRNYSLNKVLPELYELAKKYQPDLIYARTSMSLSDEYWGSSSFLTWLYNESPMRNSVVVNDQWGTNAYCSYGDFLSRNPSCSEPRRSAKWENLVSLDKKSLGYRRDAKAEDYITVEELISVVAKTLSQNGNVLINVGVTPYGRIAAHEEYLLQELGRWLEINQEAIYDTQPKKGNCSDAASNVWYTSKSNFVYAIVLKWPESGFLKLPCLNPMYFSNVTMLGSKETVNWQAPTTDVGIYVVFSGLQRSTLPSKWAWVLKFTQLENSSV